LPLVLSEGAGKAPPATTPSQETSAPPLFGGRLGPFLGVEEEPLSAAKAGSAGLAMQSLPAVTLVLGGARSGKSRYAEGLIETAAMHATYCATAEPGDAEMAARIAAHRARRQEVGGGEFWHTVEAPLDLPTVVVREIAPDRPMLVDCLTLWLSNLLLADKSIGTETRLLCAALGEAAGPVVLVANEVGLGLVPETPLGRRFRDEAGRLDQAVAAVADRVVFMAAGLPLVLKEPR
jgi:adenosylcobinamide kinase / adenosylcobinamide-phosphate guanylyltransferase